MTFLTYLRTYMYNNSTCILYYHTKIPNPGLAPDIKAIIQTVLEAGLSPAAVSKLTHVPYSTVYNYHKNLQNYGTLTPPKIAKMGAFESNVQYTWRK